MWGYIPFIVTKDAAGNPVKHFSNVNLVKYKYCADVLEAEGLTSAHLETRSVVVHNPKP